MFHSRAAIFLHAIAIIISYITVFADAAVNADPCSGASHRFPSILIFARFLTLRVPGTLTVLFMLLAFHRKKLVKVLIICIQKPKLSILRLSLFKREDW